WFGGLVRPHHTDVRRSETRSARPHGRVSTNTMQIHPRGVVCAAENPRHARPRGSEIRGVEVGQEREAFGPARGRADGLPPDMGSTTRRTRETYGGTEDPHQA